METGESALDVLSRAATMVQENSTTNTTEGSSKQSANTKQLPTAKWKRDRRSSRLPDYTRKSEGKPSAEIDDDQSTNHQENVPLDMTVSRQRGQPPSYTQTINSPTFRSNYRPSVIQNREDLPPGISMCDPIIDEHFRRSLGNDYLTLFSNNNVKETNAKAPTKNSNGVMDTSGLSVDDHFAKALGDTWVKLNKNKEPELSTNNTGDKHSLVTI